MRHLAPAQLGNREEIRRNTQAKTPSKNPTVKGQKGLFIFRFHYNNHLEYVFNTIRKRH